jgi:hypothetical protein
MFFLKHGIDDKIFDLIFDIKILWKLATTKQTDFALKKLANVFF